MNVLSKEIMNDASETMITAVQPILEESDFFFKNYLHKLYLNICMDILSKNS